MELGMELSWGPAKWYSYFLYFCFKDQLFFIIFSLPKTALAESRLEDDQ